MLMLYESQQRKYKSHVYLSNRRKPCLKVHNWYQYFIGHLTYLSSKPALFTNTNVSNGDTGF